MEYASFSYERKSQVTSPVRPLFHPSGRRGDTVSGCADRSFHPAAVVLAPMAGVTNAIPHDVSPVRPRAVYVNEMVMATAVVHGNVKTERMMTFTADEQPRSLQVYGSDPVMLGEAIRKVCAEGRVDHIDINFGCPAAKVTRKGGGAAVPAKPNLLRAILRSAVAAATPYGVPVTTVPQGCSTAAHARHHWSHRSAGGCRCHCAARDRRAALCGPGRLECHWRAQSGGARDPGVG